MQIGLLSNWYKKKIEEDKGVPVKDRQLSQEQTKYGLQVIENDKKFDAWNKEIEEKQAKLLSGKLSEGKKREIKETINNLKLKRDELALKVINASESYKIDLNPSDE